MKKDRSLVTSNDTELKNAAERSIVLKRSMVSHMIKNVHHTTILLLQNFKKYNSRTTYLSNFTRNCRYFGGDRKSINNCIAENDLLREAMRSGGNFHFQKGYKKAEKNHPKTICQYQICLVFSDISPSLYFGTNWYTNFTTPVVRITTVFSKK